MRRLRWLKVGVVALFVVLATGVVVMRTTRFQKWYTPPTLVLPADGEVIEMRASLRDFHGVPPVPEFAVPAEHVPVILGWLRPTEYNRQPWTLDRNVELGEVVIRTRTGEEFRLRFYLTGKNPALFTRDGVDQFWGRWEDNGGRGMDGSMTLCNAIRRASEAAGK